MNVEWYWTSTSSPIDDFVVTDLSTRRSLIVPRPAQGRTATVLFDSMDPTIGHSFVVTARNVVGSSDTSGPSETVYVTTEPQAPVITGEIRPNGDVFVSWLRPLGYDRIDLYEVCQHRLDGATVRCQRTRYGDWTFTDSRAGQTFGYTVRASGELGFGPVSQEIRLTTSTGFGSGYHPVTPRRVLDTRYGTGAPKRAVGPGEIVNLLVPSLPAGTRTVTLNLTATGSTASTYLQAWASGSVRPAASNLNVAPGQTVASLVTVPVGSDGRILLRNNTGFVQVIADLAGYTTPTGGSVAVAHPGTRLVDTRTGIGTLPGKLRAGGTLSFGAQSEAGYPEPTAVIVNITATGATSRTHLTAYPSNATQPTASNLNVAAGETVANLAVVRLDDRGHADLTNFAGETHVIIDLVAVYAVDTGAGFIATAPTRAMDTRIGLGAPGAVGSTPVSLALPDVPLGARAVMLRTTVTGANRSGYMQTHPEFSLSGASTLNFRAQQTVGNSTVVPVDARGVVRFSVPEGVQAHLIVDVAGYYRR
ncbi:hypothetical protein [Knoellia subterranea]|uniref:hypothetical protein n=1 Tax=Knoellia subterranea TaxID=184882 RepID=UPI001FE091E8|nr:hypothetical protein [Knoellia subterranea]